MYIYISISIYLSISISISIFIYLYIVFRQTYIYIYIYIYLRWESDSLTTGTTEAGLPQRPFSDRDGKVEFYADRILGVSCLILTYDNLFICHQVKVLGFVQKS